ncbi:MAG: class I SAM-dependent methyltransferase [Planctomycetes bacterium]|nr:class I SAM-dependent methyltransferase [Planctomycetota bacterium]
MPDAGDYHRVRLPYDEGKAALWRVLVTHALQRLVGEGQRVLDAGCGHGYFINAVRGAAKSAIDHGAEARARLDPAVRFEAGDAVSLAPFADASHDVIFASNFVEHLTWDEAGRFFASCRRVLAPGGRLILLQPNFRYCAAAYFDDYTHRSIWSHVSLPDALRAAGFTVGRVFPRWLPFQVGGAGRGSSPGGGRRWRLRLLLARLYLLLPWRPFAAQMLVVADR